MEGRGQDSNRTAELAGGVGKVAELKQSKELYHTLASNFAHCTSLSKLLTLLQSAIKLTRDCKSSVWGKRTSEIGRATLHRVAEDVRLHGLPKN